MSGGNVELAKRGYDALNAAYRSGDVHMLRAVADELWDPDIVLSTEAHVLSGGEEWHGHEGVVRFTAAQMEAFEEMWIEPDDFLESGDKLIVAVRFGGRARHTGIELEFPVTHVFTMREGRAIRMEAYASRTEALRAAGLDGPG